MAMKMFSKSLIDTDIKKRLAIPANILSSFSDFNESHAVRINLMYGTRAWPIICSIRKKGHKKPVFSGGWRNFVSCNNFDVGNRFTLYKVQDEDGSSHYRVEVEKPASRPSGVLISSPALSLYHDQIFGANVSDEATSKADNFKKEQETEMKLYGITKGIGMGEPPLHSCYMTKEERETESFGLTNGGAMAYGTTIQAAGEAYYESHTEKLSLDLVLGQPISISTP
ncbi:hypothetical protein REPUB_Repub01dG0257400 [Reevesia pubescens]